VYHFIQNCFQILLNEVVRENNNESIIHSYCFVGGYLTPHPDNPDILYFSISAYLGRFDAKSGELTQSPAFLYLVTSIAFSPASSFVVGQLSIVNCHLNNQ
jgi:hypothetical protein